MARFLAVLAFLTIVASSVLASDPELTSDFFVPPGTNASTLDGNFFTFTTLRAQAHTAPDAGKLVVTKAFSNVFTAVTGLGVSTALLEFSATSLNSPHTHPRGNEILYVLSGSLTVGFVDSANKLYEQVLQTGDLFVFPKSLVHYQVNTDKNQKATALAAFSSSNPGLIVLPSNLFGSMIPSSVLQQALSVDSKVIGQLQDIFSPVNTKHGN